MGYQHGMFSGLTTYRYGTPKKPEKPRQLIKGDRRAHVVDQVVALLKTWTSSPFEHEGTLRAHIRSGLCMAGHRWVLADLEAEAIVEECLRRIGAVRPSWAEGQWTHTDSLDFCSWCRGPMDEETRTRGQRFCSPHCARCALERRDYETQAGREAISRSAYRLIARAVATPRVCAFCGKDFRSDCRDARFCTPRCARRHEKGATLLQDQACLWCEATFHPANKGQECCSLSCRTHLRYRREEERLRESTRQCACCGTAFTPTKETDLYCTRRCGANMRNRAYLARRRAAHLAPPPLTAEVFDGWFAMAA